MSLKQRLTKSKHNFLYNKIFTHGTKEFFIFLVFIIYWSMRLETINFLKCLRAHNVDKSIRSAKNNEILEISDYIDSMIIGLGNQASFLWKSIPAEQIATNTSNNNFISTITPSKTSNWNSNKHSRKWDRYDTILISCKNKDISSKVCNCKFAGILIQADSTISNIKEALSIGFASAPFIMLKPILIKIYKIVRAWYASF